MSVAGWLKWAIFAFPMGIFGEQTYLPAGRKLELKKNLTLNPKTKKGHMVDGQNPA